MQRVAGQLSPPPLLLGPSNRTGGHVDERRLPGQIELMNQLRIPLRDFGNHAGEGPDLAVPRRGPSSPSVSALQRMTDRMHTPPQAHLRCTGPPSVPTISSAPVSAVSPMPRVRAVLRSYISLQTDHSCGVRRRETVPSVLHQVLSAGQAAWITAKLIRSGHELCDPFPVFEGQDKPDDAAAPRQTFYRDFLTERGGETEIQHTRRCFITGTERNILAAGHQPWQYYRLGGVLRARVRPRP
jgi:hypothetical protein